MVIGHHDIEVAVFIQIRDGLLKRHMGLELRSSALGITLRAAPHDHGLPRRYTELRTVPPTPKNEVEPAVTIEVSGFDRVRGLSLEQGVTLGQESPAGISPKDIGLIRVHVGEKQVAETIFLCSGPLSCWPNSPGY